jgi:hypothetical protein
MKHPLILSTWLGLLIAGIAHAQSEGDQYVSVSLKKLLTIQTIECDIRIETFVNGQEYAIWGNYVEQALPQTAPNTFLRSVYRLEISFPMKPDDSEPNRMTLVCYVADDGERHQLERYTSIEGVQSGSMINLKKLEERLKAANKEIFFSQVSEVRNLGGLAGMMRQISRFYEFSHLTQENLQGEETVPTLKLTGTLRSIHRKELLTQFGGLDNKGQYPTNFPSDIELWLGRHNDFPYKIRYLRRTSEKSEQKELLFQESFNKVVLNGTPIPFSDAKFAPLKFPEGIFSVQDDTDNFMKALGL